MVDHPFIADLEAGSAIPRTDKTHKVSGRKDDIVPPLPFGTPPTLKAIVWAGTNQFYIRPLIPKTQYDFCRPDIHPTSHTGNKDIFPIGNRFFDRSFQSFHYHAFRQIQLAKAISADLSVELAEATLYADDGASEIVKEFKSGTLSLGIDDIGSAAASDLTGATIDKNKVLISASEDGGAPVAVGFRAKKSNGKYKYYWLYRVKFGIPATNLATKGDSITFSTPTIEGTILRRNKADAGGKHPWKAEALEGDVPTATITNWYKEVYEPTYTTTPQNQG